MKKPVIIFQMAKGFLVVPVNTPVIPEDLAIAAAFTYMEKQFSYSKDSVAGFLEEYFREEPQEGPAA